MSANFATSHLLWSLPGPSAFATRVAELLDVGNSVIVASPSTVPDGLIDALRHAHNRIERRDWFALDDDETIDPLRLMLRVSCVESQVRSPVALTLAPWLRRKIVVVDAAAPRFAVWVAFLQGFSNFARSTPENDRAVFLLIGPAGLAWSAFPSSDQALAVEQFINVVRPVDFHMLAAASHSGSEDPVEFEDELRVALIRSLAGHDLELARRLALMRLVELHSPTQALRARAAELGWDVDGPQTWERGFEDGRVGGRRRHPAADYLKLGESAVHSCVWKAHVSVVFPMLERARNQLVELYRSRLTPVENQYGKVDDIRDLELGQIRVQVRSRCRPPEVRWLDCLVRVRNCLAHQEPATFADIAEISRRLR
jgi:hypothetical protein